MVKYNQAEQYNELTFQAEVAALFLALQDNPQQLNSIQLPAILSRSEGEKYFAIAYAISRINFHIQENTLTPDLLTFYVNEINLHLMPAQRATIAEQEYNVIPTQLDRDSEPTRLHKLIAAKHATLTVVIADVRFAQQYTHSLLAAINNIVESLLTCEVDDDKLRSSMLKVKTSCMDISALTRLMSSKPTLANNAELSTMLCRAIERGHVISDNQWYKLVKLMDSTAPNIDGIAALLSEQLEA